jgi:hypothetical protein
MMAEPAAQSRFLRLPIEIQHRIIKATLDLERQAFRPNQTPFDPLDTTSPQLYDFNINAYGLRCHSLPPFGLLFVNKYVSGEALAIIYQNSSFAVYAEVCRAGVPVQAFGYIPMMVKRITPMMKTNAREVTFHISTINEGGEPKCVKPKDINALTLERAVENLRLLVSEATFPHVKTLNVVLLTHGLVQKHLNMILKLFANTGCTMTLDEVCNGVFGAEGSKPKEKTFGEMVKRAAKECGQEWMSIEKPIMESRSDQGLWRGVRVSWVRHRTWSRVFAESSAAPVQA